MTGSPPHPSDMFDADLKRALDSFDVPPLSADFADRVLAALDQAPAALPPLPAPRPARDRRAGWLRRRVTFIGAPLALGIATMSAAATGVLTDFGIKIPVVTDYVTHHLGIKPIHIWHHQAHVATPQASATNFAADHSPATPSAPAVPVGAVSAPAQAANIAAGSDNSPAPPVVTSNTVPAATRAVPRHTIGEAATLSSGAVAGTLIAHRHPLFGGGLRLPHPIPALPSRALIATPRLGAATAGPHISVAAPEHPLSAHPHGLARTSQVGPSGGHAVESQSLHPFTTPETKLQAATPLERPRAVIPDEFTHLQTSADRAALRAEKAQTQDQTPRRLGNEGGDTTATHASAPGVTGSPEAVHLGQNQDHAQKPAPRPHQPRAIPHRR